MIKTTSDFQPSTYQEAIFQAVQRGEKAIVISAVPGAGKTTTCQQLVRYIPVNATVLMVAFNVEAAKQLQSKIDDLLRSMQNEGIRTPLVECRTIHSLGNGTLASAGIRGRAIGYKYSKITKEYLQSKGIWDTSLSPDLADLCDKVRLTLAPVTKPLHDEDVDTIEKNASILRAVCNQFDINIDEEYQQLCFDAVIEILQAGINQAHDGTIDFTDMIYLPHALRLSPRRYDYVLVDEAQDLNAAQRELVLKAVRKNGHFVAVGDKNQAIYGFAGASHASIQEIIDATDAIELPLSICYRCPISIVQMAASIHPGIESAPNMAEGKIITMDDGMITHEVQSGDLVLCRTTAPLIDLCFTLLRQGKRATVRGRDLEKSLGAIVKQIQKFCRSKNNPMHIHNLEESADVYLLAQLATLQGEKDNIKRISLQDKIDTLLCLFDHYKTDHALSSLDAFIDYIIDFFKEDPHAQIILSTGHRAKGLEFPRVFVVSSNKQPHPLAKTHEAIIQEKNLMYVMYTRVLHQAHNPESGKLFLGTASDFKEI